MPIQRIPWERHPFGEGSLRDEVKDKIQTTIEREPDFLKRIIDQDGKESPEGILQRSPWDLWCILQLEFQTTNDPKMIYRMVEYRGILLQRSPSDKGSMKFRYVRL